MNYIESNERLENDAVQVAIGNFFFYLYIYVNHYKDFYVNFRMFTFISTKSNIIVSKLRRKRPFILVWVFIISEVWRQIKLTITMNGRCY